MAKYEVELEFYTLPYEDEPNRKLIQVTVTLEADSGLSAIAMASQVIDAPYEVTVAELRKQSVPFGWEVLDLTTE